MVISSKAVLRILITGALLMFFQCIHVERTTELNPDLDFIDIDGYRFHVRRAGNPDHPPLIVLHGGPGGDFHYLLSLDQLADQYSVLYYDQRMSGLSSRRSDREPGPEQDMMDLHALVERFAGDRKVVLIGHSYGAMIATGYVARHPERVSHAVIIEPGILTRESAGIFIRSLKESTGFLAKLRVLPALLKSVFVKSEDGHERMDFAVGEMMEGGGGRPYQCDGVRLPGDSFVRAGYALMKKTTIPLMSNPEGFDVDLVGGLKGFDGRLLLLSSECSFIGYDYQEANHRRFYPVQTLHLKLDNTGHNFLTTDPGRGIAVIREFLMRPR